MKNKLLLLIALTLFFLSNKAQDAKSVKKAIKEADEMFDIDDFKNAEMKYLAIWKFDSTNTELNLNLAICKYKLRELPDSVL